MEVEREEVDNLDERVERVVDHTRRLEELREEKREQLYEQDTDEENRHALTGWIRDARLDEQAGEYVLDVDIHHADDTRREEYRLDWPEEIDDANVENDVFRLARLTGDGDGLDDIIEQEVPILHIDGEYRLDFPATPALPDRLRHRVHRRALDAGVFTYDEGDRELATTAHTTALAITSSVTGAAAVSAYSTLLAGDVGSPQLFSDVIMAGVMAMFGFVLVAGFLGDTHADDDPVATVFKTGLGASILAALATALGIAEPAVAPEALLPFAHFALTSLGIITLGVISVIAGVGTANRTITRTTSTASRAFSRARNWIRRRRSIDYLR